MVFSKSNIKKSFLKSVINFTFVKALFHIPNSYSIYPKIKALAGTVGMSVRGGLTLDTLSNLFAINTFSCIDF